MNTLNLTYTKAQLDIFFNHPEPRPKFKVVTKGRRFGATKGAANAFIELGLDGVSPLLWVDTINGNIERYFDRYFQPVLKHLDESMWSFNRQKKELKINGSIIDFRSADAPESIEGFGYKLIFLNEAGIILKDDYLYSNAILPMLLDYEDSMLIAAGVPKGKSKKGGKKHKFYELYERAIAKEKGYSLHQYTSYDNPMLRKEDIDQLALSMTQQEIMQEIYGQFVDFAGNNPFATQLKPEKHVSLYAQYDPSKQLCIVVDFNMNPFSVIFCHNFQDQDGFHAHQFDEAEIQAGSIPAMIDLIKKGPYARSLPTCKLSGDAMGKRGDISQRDNSSYYQQLQKGLGLKESQIVTPANPTHENSRADTNYVLLYHPDFIIHPRCEKTIRDLKIVQCDAYGSIIKANRKDVSQMADYIDCVRYNVNTFWRAWIDKHQRGVFNSKKML